MNLTELFNTDQLLLNSAFSPLQIILSLLVTLCLVLFVYFVYRKTYTGVLYSKNFNLTLVITALVVNAIMIGISGNIVLSLGLVGALSIIRFRTAVKDPKDTAFLFWAITIGVINGVAYYELAVIASIFIAAVLFFFSTRDQALTQYLLIISYQGDTFSEVERVLQTYFKNYATRNCTVSGDITEKVVEVQIGKQNSDNIIKEIQNLANVNSCVLVSSNGEFAD